MLHVENDSEIALLGHSDAIRTITADVDVAARSDAKVLITGETGVGKEIVARLIHHRSTRRQARLVVLNCAGVPESLLESELFGHVRGSFTDAHRDKKGLLESAADGTLFLDEIGETSLRMQAVLLRFVQSGEIQRVGATTAHQRVNVRLLCATNRDLVAQIAAGTFREDLYFRLNVISLFIPPLRDRLEDIPLLVQHFLDEFGRQHRTALTLAPETLALMARYRWPGNVRELRNVIERVVVKARAPVVLPSDLPADLLRMITASSADNGADAVQAARSTVSRVHALATRMLVYGESFWAVVAPLVSSNELTREELRKIVRLGLERTEGSYRHLLPLFNLPGRDQAKFLNFLRENDCHLPSYGLRTPARLARARTANDMAD